MLIFNIISRVRALWRVGFLWSVLIERDTSWTNSSWLILIELIRPMHDIQMNLAHFCLPSLEPIESETRNIGAPLSTSNTFEPGRKEQNLASPLSKTTGSLASGPPLASSWRCWVEVQTGWRIETNGGPKADEIGKGWFGETFAASIP